MFKIKPPVKVITPQIPDGSITKDKLAFRVYCHYVKITNGTLNTSKNITLAHIFTGSGEAFTSETLAAWLYDGGFNSDSKVFPVADAKILPGTEAGSTTDIKYTEIRGIYSENGTTVKCAKYSSQLSIDNGVLKQTSYVGSYITADSIKDTVTELI